jgi:hypothetical protein
MRAGFKFANEGKDTRSLQGYMRHRNGERREAAWNAAQPASLAVTLRLGNLANVRRVLGRCGFSPG